VDRRFLDSGCKAGSSPYIGSTAGNALDQAHMYLGQRNSARSEAGVDPMVGEVDSKDVVLFALSDRLVASNCTSS